MQSKLVVKGKTYKLPIFLPDATLGVVRSLDSGDLAEVGTRGAVVNTYHLMSDPGIELLRKVGGIKKFMNFDGLVVSDSGGWQVFSLPRKITDEGVVFKIGGGRNQIFTPEKSIQVQFEIGSDIIICLDDFTQPGSSRAQIEESVRRTTLWAKRCKAEFDRLGASVKEKPLLFAVIQGGNDRELRERNARELIEIGFDGYGFGGYAVDEATHTLDLGISKFIADLIPNDKFKFALGVGKPQDILALKEMGWDIFDCTLPTRDARHGRLYVSGGTVQVTRSKFAADLTPIEDGCGCHTCQNYTRAYLYHLFKMKETLAYRLATIHNLHFYNGLF